MGAKSGKSLNRFAKNLVEDLVEPKNTMRSISSLTLLVFIPLAVLPQLALADVFKCTTADGKTSYSATPCTAAGAKEVVVPIVSGTIGSPGEGQGRNWAAENAAINARVQASEAARADAAAQRGAASGKTAEQIAAECEANHGVDCSSDKAIAKRRSDERTLTPDEAEALQRASAGRRKNERDAAAAAEPPKPVPPTPTPAPQPGNGFTAPSKT